MAKNSTALAPTAPKTDSSALALAPADALAGALDGLDLGTDGLEEINRDDIKLAVKVLNFKGVDSSGEPIPPNAYYDTIEETTSKSISAVLLTLHKTNEWREYDEAKGESVIHCRSYDQKVGTMSDGTTRPCQGCPDADWRMVEGKRKRNCGEVHNVVGIDRLTQSAFLLRCKKTSLDPFKTYLNKHFIGKRMVGPKRANVPLFAFETRLSAKMSDDRKYAIPVFERGDVLPKEEILNHSEFAMFYREHMLPALAKAEKAEGESTTDSSFEFGANASGGDPQVFDAPSAPNAF